MSSHKLQRFVLAMLLILLSSVSPVVAESTLRPQPSASVSVAPARVVLAESWSLGKFITGGRSRVVQFCVVVMFIALFIMMKKFT